MTDQVMSDYLISTRKVRKKVFSSEPGPTRFLDVPSSRLPDPKHEVTRTEFIERIIGSTAGPTCADVVFFIHGYNVTQRDLIRRHRSIQRGLKSTGFAGRLISFDWPAFGSAANYLEDRSDARRVALQLVDDGLLTFAGLVKKGCTVNMHVLAHSTGAFIIREALDDADDRSRIAQVNWSLSQIVYVAADVSSKSMSDSSANSNSLYRHCVRLTNYSNPFDSVLKLSNVKRIGVAPRAGRVGLPGDAHSKAVNVDCGERFRQLYPEDGPVVDPKSHSWHFDDPLFFQDLSHTLVGDLDRHVIPTRTGGHRLALKTE